MAANFEQLFPRFPGFPSSNVWRQRRGRQTNALASSVRESTTPVAGPGAPIPIIYGQKEVAPKLFWYTVTSSRVLVLQAVWCLGEIDSIVEVKINDETLPSGVTVTHYTGTTSQTADATLSSLITGYDNNMVLTVGGESIGIAYSVIQIPNDVIDGFPRLTADIKGLKVYDPRDGAQLENDKSTWLYSDNPSLCAANFETSSIYGRGRTVNWTSVETCADDNDELVEGNKRRTINLDIRKRGSVDSHIESLARYAGVFVNERDGETYFVSDRPKSSIRTLTASDIQNLQLREPKLSSKPTVVTVGYTDTSGDKPKDGQAVAKLAGVDAGTTPWREQSLKMPGINNHEEAYRYAVEELNSANVINLEGDFITRDEGLLDEIGDVQTITHPRGLTNKEVQIVGHEQVELGRWRIEFVEYDEDRFSDEVVSGPNFNDTSLPSAFDVPTLNTPTLTEEVYQTKSGIYASRIRATWTATDYPYSFRYEYQVLDGTDIIWTGTTVDEEFATGPVQEDVNYTVKVRVSAVGLSISGEFASSTITAEGKGLIPSDVPQITATQIGSDVVRLQWEEAVDIDVWRYRIKQGSTSDDWDSATEIDLVDGLQLKVEGLSATAYRFFVKAVDSIRQESTNATTVDVTLTKPSMTDTLSGFEVGGEVRLSWGEGTGYVKSYIVRYGAVGFSWANGTTLDNVNALRLVTKDVAEGEWDFVVRAQDFNGNVSDDESRVTIDVTSDSDAFLADDVSFDSPTLTNMKSWSHRPEGNSPVTYVTEMGDTPASLWPNAMSTYTNPLSTYHTSGSSEWLSETYDFGTSLSGNFSATIDAEALSGSITKILELSSDNSNWDQYTSLSVKATAQYARVRIQAETTSTLKVTAPDVSVKVNVVPREEKHDISYVADRSMVDLDGVDGKFEVTGTTGHPTGNSAFTVEGWVKINSLPSDDALLMVLSGNRRHFIGIKNNGNIWTGSWGQENKNGKAAPFKEYFHYASVYNGVGDVIFYINGFLFYEYIVTDFDLTGGLEFGAPLGTSFQSYAEISKNSVRYWNTTRTQQEIKDNMFKELTGSESGLVGLWPCNDGSGTTVTDLTSNSNDGTLSGGYSWLPRGTRVQLNNDYSATQSVIVTPLGSSARSAAADEITMGSPSFFDVFIFDSATGSRVDNDAIVTFKGV